MNTRTSKLETSQGCKVAVRDECVALLVMTRGDRNRYNEIKKMVSVSMNIKVKKRTKKDQKKITAATSL